MSDVSSTQYFMENNELREIFDLTISRIPEKRRQIYQLAWQENLSHKEIAGQLGITQKPLKTM